MPAFPREGRIRKLNEELEEARSDASLLRAGHMRLLQTLSERDQAVHEKNLLEGQLVTSRDQLRLMAADRIVKHGPFEISNAEQDDAYLRADQVEILPDEEGKTVRFRLNETIALRPPKPAPPAPLAAVPPPTDTDGTPSSDGTEPSGEPGSGPRAVDPAGNNEPLPS